MGRRCLESLWHVRVDHNYKQNCVIVNTHVSDSRTLCPFACIWFGSSLLSILSENGGLSVYTKRKEKQTSMDLDLKMEGIFQKWFSFHKPHSCKHSFSESKGTSALLQRGQCYNCAKCTTVDVHWYSAIKLVDLALTVTIC